MADVLAHGKYILGPEVGELEQTLAEYVGVKHCIACASGTDALLIALMALGIKAGDEVITTAFTYVATGEVIARLGATPVFADVDPETLCLALPAGLLHDPARDKLSLAPGVRCDDELRDVRALHEPRDDLILPP